MLNQLYPTFTSPIDPLMCQKKILHIYPSFWFQNVVFVWETERAGLQCYTRCILWHRSGMQAVKMDPVKLTGRNQVGTQIWYQNHIYAISQIYNLGKLASSISHRFQPRSQVLEVPLKPSQGTLVRELKPQVNLRWTCWSKMSIFIQPLLLYGLYQLSQAIDR